MKFSNWDYLSFVFAFLGGMISTALYGWVLWKSIIMSIIVLCIWYFGYKSGMECGK